MHIQFTHLSGGLLACEWCSGVATDPEHHARWHWRNEGRGVGDASASGPSFGVEPGLTVTVAMGDPLPAPGGYAYGAALTEGQAVAHGLLPGPLPPDDAEDDRPAQGPQPFPAPVHAVPQTYSQLEAEQQAADARQERARRENIGPQPLTDPITGARRSPE